MYLAATKTRDDNPKSADRLVTVENIGILRTKNVVAIHAPERNTLFSLENLFPILLVSVSY